MSHLRTRVFFVVGGAVVVLLLAATAVGLFLDVNRDKPRFEAAASQALGMAVRIDGRIGIGFFPTFHVTLHDGRVLDAHGVTLVAAKRTHLWVALLPPLRP
jgi:uncharacterized protein involved in outer membrane biogenesis